MLSKTLLSSLILAACVAGLPRDRIEAVTVHEGLNFSTYAPVQIQCPERKQWVRPGHGISEEEAKWVAARKKKVLGGLTSYLRRLNLVDFDLDEYLKRLTANTTNVPTIGLGISGGGWASGLTGTGALLAFDDRFGPACEQRTGGLLQSMTYLSGLSGGSWPVMSLATYNFPTIPDMVSNWHVDQSATFAKKNTAYRATPPDLFKEIVPKFDAGFKVGLMDLLGRGFAYEFVAGSNGGMETMLSDIADLNSFRDHDMPFPMWQASLGTDDDIKYFGLQVPYYNATIFEWNPLEFGAWGGPAAFFPTKYLGTKMSNGSPLDGKCIVGYDRAGFMLGLAADATNFWMIEALSNGTEGWFAKRSQEDDTIEQEDLANNIAFPLSVMKDLEAPFKEVFNYTLSEMMYATLPNPFVSSKNTEPANLTMLDESEAGQPLPLWSQIQQARNPEFLIAWDNDQDAHPYGWNNGTTLYISSIYATNNSVPFPIIPPPATFINRKLSTKPTLFGCDPNLTNMNDTRAPIVAYMANAPYSAYTNFTWTESVFSHEQMAVLLTNDFNLVTAGNGTLDTEWPECLGCAAIDRSLAKVGMERTPQCQACMTKYCWDGVEDNADPGLVDLPLMLDPNVSFAEWNRSVTEKFWPEIEPRSSV